MPEGFQLSSPIASELSPQTRSSMSRPQRYDRQQKPSRDVQVKIHEESKSAILREEHQPLVSLKKLPINLTKSIRNIHRGRHLPSSKDCYQPNGCSNFLVQHDAIKMMGSHAKKESSQITHIGGVGNTLTHNPWDVQCQHPDDQRTGRFTHRNLHGPNHLNFSTIPIDRSVQGDMPIVRR